MYLDYTVIAIPENPPFMSIKLERSCQFVAPYEIISLVYLKIETFLLHWPQINDGKNDFAEILKFRQMTLFVFIWV